VTRWFRIGGAVALVALAAEFAMAVPASLFGGQLLDWIRGAGLAGVGVYAGVYVAATVFLVPGVLLTAGAGLLYGPWFGTLLVSPVSVAAATVSFILGRTVARGWIARRIEGNARFRAVDAAIGHRGFRVVALLRLSPVVPFNVLNYALGLTSVGLRDYLLGSFVGMLPSTFLYVYLGSLVDDVAAVASGTGEGADVRRYLYWVGLVATVAVTVYITRVARAALDEELGENRPEDPGP
jgi:uncharacterized membrane protein YdjX (TVP38/TMEM64 family)